MVSASDPLDDFELGAYSGGGFTRDVYRSGEGPNCIVMAEIPGITPRVADFARRVRSLGCSVTLPVLFGTPGRPPSPGYIARSVAKACVSSEFAAFAVGRTAPISLWLRSLAAAEHQRCGGPGVGAVGMCFTGGFALGMMVEEATIAPVLSQPSLPLGPGRRRAGDVHLAPEDQRAAQARAAEGVCVLGARFSDDPLSPRRRFRALEDLLGDNFVGVEIDSSRGNQLGIRRMAHSVLTEDLVDEPGHPTREALDQVLQFLSERLLPQSD
ncbi:MAG: dienelactone hydrolase [Microthrixaceae bacterium]